MSMSDDGDIYNFENDYDDEKLKILKYRLKYHPPTLVIEYENKSKSKSMQRRIKFKNNAHKGLASDTIASQVIEKNSDILSKDTVSYQQLVDLINLLLFSDVSETSSLIDDIKVTKLKGGIGGVNGEIDLNKVSSLENAKAKELMSEAFESKRLKPTDAGFVYDKRIDFEPPSEVCEWDDE
jgi:diacylglycerol kinase family enzyme